jgi:regulator of sigma E protease
LDVLTHSLIPFFFILLLLLVVHEGGHYVAAKLLGVTVLEAGIGLPPRIWGFRWRNTDYTINALPIGAFVRLLGEEDPSDPKSLAAQPKWKRSVILGAGVVMNLVLAIALFTAGLMIPHRVDIGGASIGGVNPGSPAQQADLRAGDQILKVNGRKVENSSDALYLTLLKRGSNIDFTIGRKDPRSGTTETETKSVYARWNPPTYIDDCGVEQPQGSIGISIAPAHTVATTTTAAERARAEAEAKKAFAAYQKKLPANASSSCQSGAKFGFVALTAPQCADLDEQARSEAQALKEQLFSSSSDPCYEFRPPQAYIVPSESRSEPPWRAVPHATRMAFESLILARNQIWSLVRGFNNSSPLTGPVGIAQATGEVVHEAGWLSLINFAALISMSLALLNVLPIPMVDGGRLMFIVIEFLRRGKRVPPEKEALVHFAGFVAMALGALVITYFDIVRIVTGGSLLR